MAEENQPREEGSERDQGAPDRQGHDLSDESRPLAEGPPLPSQTPLYHAYHAARYDRQDLIRQYEAEFDCRLVVVVDQIFGYGITLFEELIQDVDPSKNLHLMLYTPGGDGETAVRLARCAQARCREFTVIVPDSAKSAGTLLALGAHKIMMGPTSDLGPVDPQFRMQDGSLVSAKEIISAVEDASNRVADAPDTYPLHASLLSDVTALMVERAKSALLRTDDLLKEALRSNPDRTEDEVDSFVSKLVDVLVNEPSDHRALFDLRAAQAVNLPVFNPGPQSRQWQILWRLWTKYFAAEQRFYESASASQQFPWPQPGQPG